MNEYTFNEFDLESIIEQLEDSDYPLDEDIQMDEIFEDGNLWAADPAELAEVTEEHPLLDKYIRC